MKIKTKRGARRIRNQRVVTRKRDYSDVIMWDFVIGQNGEYHHATHTVGIPCHTSAAI